VEVTRTQVESIPILLVFEGGAKLCHDVEVRKRPRTFWHIAGVGGRMPEEKG